MRIVRPATAEDLEALNIFANTMTLGVTSLPKDPKLMEKKLHSFIFILEDLETGDKIGTCQISPRTKTWLFQLNDNELVPVEIEGPTEIKGLFLLPEFRHENLGKLLSWSRFLFLAAYPHLFQEEVIAQMRGVITQDDTSPFWDSFGKKVMGITLIEALEQYSRLGTSPLELKRSVPLKDVDQSVLGVTHSNTAPALNFLLENGFHKLPLIDPVDGGPTLMAKSYEISAVKACKTYTLTGIKDLNDEEETLICFEWRVADAPFKIEGEDVFLNKETVDALKLQLGDQVTVMVPQAL